MREGFDQCRSEAEAAEFAKGVMEMLHDGIAMPEGRDRGLPALPMDSRAMTRVVSDCVQELRRGGLRPRDVPEFQSAALALYMGIFDREQLKLLCVEPGPSGRSLFESWGDTQSGVDEALGRERVEALREIWSYLVLEHAAPPADGRSPKVEQMAYGRTLSWPFMKDQDRPRSAAVSQLLGRR